jgi:hypothetical protein
LSKRARYRCCNSTDQKKAGLGSDFCASLFIVSS